MIELRWLAVITPRTKNRLQFRFVKNVLEQGLKESIYSEWKDIPVVLLKSRILNLQH